MYILVVLAIQEDHSLCHNAKFSENLHILVIFPTKYLEHQMVCVCLLAITLLPLVFLCQKTKYKKLNRPSDMSKVKYNLQLSVLSGQYL